MLLLLVPQVESCGVLQVLKPVWTGHGQGTLGTRLFDGT